MSDEIEYAKLHLVVIKDANGHVEVSGAGCNCENKCQEQAIWKFVNEKTELHCGKQYEITRHYIPYDPNDDTFMWD